MSNDDERARHGAHWGGAARETYWDHAAAEAAGRAGRGPQLKGVIHEVAVRDRANLAGALDGARTQFTRSNNARAVDLVTTKSGRVVQRIQVKDVTSDAGIGDLTRRVGRQQYRTARLVGTKETAARYAREGLSKPMASSGVSSRTTTRAADNAGARVRTGGLTGNNLRDIGGFAGTAAGVGAAVGVVAEAVGSLRELRQGEIDGWDYTGRVVASGVKAGVGSGARTAAALGLKEGGKVVATRVGAEGLRRFAGSNAGTAVAFGAVEQAIDTVRWIKGDLDGAAYGESTARNVGATGGAVGGAWAGAAIGSAVPVVGTAIGAVVGGIVGSLLGGKGGKAAGRKLFG